MLDEKAFFITINQVATLSLRTYGMAVKKSLQISNKTLAPSRISVYTMINGKQRHNHRTADGSESMAHRAK